MKKIIDKIIIIFLFLQPILDVITSIQIRYNIMSIYIASVIRVIFMLFILIYMIIYKYDFKLIILMFIYGLIEGSYILLTNNIPVLFNAIKIFYLPVLLIFFANYELKIEKKYILIIYLIYMLFLVVPTICGFSFDVYNNLEDKKGFIGLFYGGNELSGILLGFLPIIIIYLKDIKIYYRIIYSILIIATFILVSTKTLFIGGVLVLLIYLINYIKNKKMKNKKVVIGSILGIFAILLIILPYTPVMNNIKITLDYYGINNITQMFNYNTIDNVIFSRRLQYAGGLVDKYKKVGIEQKLFGLKEINTIKDSELDLIDTYMTIGLIGFIVYIFIMIYLIKKYKLSKPYSFSMILFIIMSCFSGHILIKPVVSIYIALLYNLNKEGK